MTDRLDDALFPDLLEADYAAQLRRVRRIAAEALKTAGARRLGLVLWLFAPVFARWFVNGITKRGQRPPLSPFVYTMR